MGTTYRELFKLYDLIQCGDITAIEVFLRENTVPSVNEILPCKGIGVLHLAVGIEPLDKSKKCTELILKHGGDPNIHTDDGVTPVHIAAIWGRVDNLKLLIGCGGDPGRCDLDGVTAFDYAAREQQWEVYDYLHNVIDQAEDSFGSSCAYTLDLDKVLVTTEQMVAEYEPIERNTLFDSTAPRKSEMIRDWCEKSSLVVNKLYPTILGETYLIENESVPWKSGDFTKNITLDLTNNRTSNHSVLNETNASYKTCMTKNVPYNLEISGVKQLEVTVDKSNCHCSQSSSSSNVTGRMSVYENFSLPGSPNSIMHKNYNTKSSLKKCKKQCMSSLCSDMQHMMTLDSSKSLISDDKSNADLDRAMVVVQNKTNEFLSSNVSSVTDMAMNTRRSSASSGVSSNFSGGSIVIANMQEEYKYEDKKEDIVLIEKRLLVSSIVLPLEEGADTASPDQTVLSVASSLPSSVQFDNNTLRAELLKRGFRPGPIQDSTRTLYLKKLQALKKNPIVVTNQGKRSSSSFLSTFYMDDRTLRAQLMMLGYTPGPIVESTRSVYVWKLQSLKQLSLTENKNRTLSKKTVPADNFTYSIELEKSLRSDEWTRNLTPYIELENKVRADFANPSKKWREGTTKTSFTYLLLDPRVTDNLPARAGKQPHQMSWSTFVNSIFYVGKGKRSRPYSHLYQALTLWKQDFTSSKDKKVQQILDIWSDKVGVICLHIFQNVIPAEAYTYEAAMIDVLGINNLKNLKSGNYYGVSASWPLKERRMLGLYLLYKALQIFLSEGERQLRPDDID